MSEGSFAPEALEDLVVAKQPEINEVQSSREYAPTQSIARLLALPLEQRKVVDKPITAATKVCLIGDGQGADTKLFSSVVRPENITSVNYDLREVTAANERFEREGSAVRMKQADITNADSLRNAGLAEGSQDLVVAAHVLEVPIFNTQIGDEVARQKAAQNEKSFADNIANVLKPNGEALIFSYPQRLTQKEATRLGVEKVTPDAAKFYDIEWRQDLTYAELSAIRSQDELTKLFGDKFTVIIDNTADGYAVRLKNSPL